MKTIATSPVFQGDLMIRRIDVVPVGARPADGTDNVHILAHSETGHHHVIDSRAAQRLIDATNAFITYLNVSSETEVEHLRDFDKHESILLTPGLYEVRQQREYVAEGFRRVED